MANTQPATTSPAPKRFHSTIFNSQSVPRFCCGSVRDGFFGCLVVVVFIAVCRIVYIATSFGLPFMLTGEDPTFRTYASMLVATTIGVQVLTLVTSLASLFAVNHNMQKMIYVCLLMLAFVLVADALLLVISLVHLADLFHDQLVSMKAYRSVAISCGCWTLIESLAIALAVFCMFRWYGYLLLQTQPTPPPKQEA